MIFWFKKKPIVLYCLTDRPNVLASAPVKLAGRCLPDWWKALSISTTTPNRLGAAGTMKNCSGFTGLYEHGLMLPLWSDLALEIGEENNDYYKYQYADKQSVIQHHGAEQHGNQFSARQYQHLKLQSPWRFVCDERVSFLFCEPTWALLKYTTLSVLPGILEFKYQDKTNINMFIRRTKEVQQLTLPYLLPLAHVIPLSERPLKIVVSDDAKLWQKTKYMHTPVTFVRSYKNFLKEKK